jgi:hypothetical protein
MAKPQGVRIVREDGTVTPCELIHIGEVDGEDVWEITGVIFHSGRDMLQMDELPPRTGIQFTGAME